MYIHKYTYMYIYNFVEIWGSFAEIVCASVCARKSGALLRKSRTLLQENQHAYKRYNDIFNVPGAMTALVSLYLI